jgi:hypothetical protein
MKRASWIALFTATMISGAAAISVEAPMPPVSETNTPAQRATTLEAARAAQRAFIDARYQSDRAQCESLGGAKRDRCLIEAHARKGRAMLEAAAPYAVRS